MKNHSLAVTAVGIAQGTSTLARSRARPLNCLFITRAIIMPRTTSRTTVTTVNSTVTVTASQNSLPRVPGGQFVAAAPLEQPVGVVGEPGVPAALVEEPALQGLVLVEGLHDGGDHRIADDQCEQQQHRTDQEQRQAALTGGGPAACAANRPPPGGCGRAVPGRGGVCRTPAFCARVRPASGRPGGAGGAASELVESAMSASSLTAQLRGSAAVRTGVVRAGCVRWRGSRRAVPRASCRRIEGGRRDAGVPNRGVSCRWWRP